MYKFILYNVELLQVKQKNRTIIKKVYRYLMTINNIDKKDTSRMYINIYNNHIKEFKGLTIHMIKQESNHDYLLNNCYIYDNNGSYKKYICERGNI